MTPKKKLYLEPNGYDGWAYPVEKEPEHKGGVCFYVLWDDVIKQTRNSGMLRDGETVERMEVDHNGVAIYVKGKS
jgi:hypothetical protein